MLCSILIALDTSSLVYIGFCTSFVATLLGHHSWLRHSVMTQFNVATHDVQKPIYTREEVSNVILEVHKNKSESIKIVRFKRV